MTTANSNLLAFASLLLPLENSISPPDASRSILSIARGPRVVRTMSATACFRSFGVLRGQRKGRKEKRGMRRREERAWNEIGLP